MLVAVELEVDADSVRAANAAAAERRIQPEMR